MNRSRLTVPLALALAALLHPGARAAEPVTLDHCIRTALERNPTAAAARERVAAARAALAQARSAWLPRASLGANYALTDNAPQAFMMELNQRLLNMADPAFDPNHPDDTDNLRLSAGVRYRLFDRVRDAQAGMARHGAEASAGQLAGVQNELIHQVTRAYHGVLQAGAFAAVQDEAVRSLEENLRVAQDRFAAGAVVRTDVLNLDVQLAQGREDLIRARHGVELARAALNSAVGAGLPADGVAAPPAEPPAPLPAPADAIEARPELAAMRAVENVRREAARKARGDFAPVVNAFGSYDWDANPGDDFEESYLVGVAAEWEIFSGGQRRAAANQALAEWRAARSEVARTVSDLRLDLEQARVQQADAWERLGVTGKGVASAEEALRITLERYQKGAAPITELLMAQVARTATRTRRTAALYDYLTARSNVARATGGLVAAYVDNGGAK